MGSRGLRIVESTRAALLLPSRDSALVCSAPRGAQSASARRVAADTSRATRPHRRTHRFGQDPRGVSLGNRYPSDLGRFARDTEAGNDCAVHLAPPGTGQRRPEEPTGTDRRDSCARSDAARHTGTGPIRGYATERARAHDQDAAPRARDNTGVALYPADKRQRTEDAAHDSLCHRRRDPRHAARQARLTPGALDGAPGGARRAVSADRPERDAETAG